MAMSGGKDDGSPMMEMNMTPLIDVLLVLLVMFIITIPVMTHAVKLDMPRPNNAPPLTTPVVINLEIMRASEEMVQGTEGCLSVPGWMVGSDAVTLTRRKNHKTAGLDRFEEVAAIEPVASAAIPEGCVAVPSLVAGNLWKLMAQEIPKSILKGVIIDLF